MSNETTKNSTLELTTLSETIEVIPTAAPLSKTQFNYLQVSDMLVRSYESVRRLILKVNLICAALLNLTERVIALEARVLSPIDPNPTLPPPGQASPEPDPQTPVNPTPNVETPALGAAFKAVKPAKPRG